MINNKKHLLFSYDESEAMENEREYIKENWKDFLFDEKPEDYQIDDYFSETNYDFLNFYYYDFEKVLVDFLDKDIYFADHANGMGWRNLEGYKVFKANTPKQFITAITPNTQDFTLEFYQGGKRFFYVKIYHHDAPMGERHKIRRLTEKEYNKLTE